MAFPVKQELWECLTNWCLAFWKAVCIPVCAFDKDGCTPLDLTQWERIINFILYDEDWNEKRRMQINPPWVTPRSWADISMPTADIEWSEIEEGKTNIVLWCDVNWVKIEPPVSEWDKCCYEINVSDRDWNGCSYLVSYWHMRFLDVKKCQQCKF